MATSYVLRSKTGKTGAGYPILNRDKLPSSDRAACEYVLAL